MKRKIKKTIERTYYPYLVRKGYCEKKPFNKAGPAQLNRARGRETACYANQAMLVACTACFVVSAAR